VYAGIDPITRKKHHLTEVVPAGPKAAKEAEKVRTKLLAEVDQRRNPRTNATVNQLLERYLGVLRVEYTTRDGYERLVRNTSNQFSATSQSDASTARRSTPTTPNSSGAVSVARVGRISSTAVAMNTNATNVAARTAASRSATARSARSTPCLAAPSPARCAGVGSARTQFAKLSSRRREHPTLDPRPLCRQLASLPRHGTIRTGGCSCGSP
jgi:hypothetical protein